MHGLRYFGSRFSQWLIDCTRLFSLDLFRVPLYVLATFWSFFTSKSWHIFVYTQILALILEGRRRQGSRRRSQGREYRKLDTNVEVRQGRAQDFFRYQFLGTGRGSKGWIFVFQYFFHFFTRFGFGYNFSYKLEVYRYRSIFNWVKNSKFKTIFFSWKVSWKQCGLYHMSCC